MTKPSHSLRAAALCIVLAVACGKNGSVTNLKPVFFRTVAAAPVATLTMKLQSGAAMTKATATFDSRPLFDGWLKVGRTATATANANGVASLALPAGSYPMRLASGVPASTALVGDLLDTLSISQDTNKAYQTSQQSWTVTSPKAFSSLLITVYQVDGNGRAMVGDTNTPLDPLVLSAAPAVPGNSATTLSFNTELFKGSYRAVLSATPVTATDSIAPFETATFQAAGGGIVEPQTVALASGGNVVILNFVEAGAPLPDSQIGDVLVFDAGSLLFLSHAASKNGSATVSTGSVGSVIAFVQSPNDEAMAAGAYTAAPAPATVTLTRYTVAGHVKAPGGAALGGVGANSFGTVTAALNSGLGSYWDPQVAAAPVGAKITDGLGTYQLKLFAASYSLRATQLKNLPSSAAIALNLSADALSQDVTVDAGGIISGTLQDEGHNNIPNADVTVWDSSHKLAGGTSTDANGTWSLAVPFGTYEVFVSGALTRDVGVSSAASTKTLSMTRFQLTGRLIDAAQGPVAGKAFWGGGNVTASSLGTYTLNAVQGVNWFLFTPPTTSPSLGFAYETDVLVNADTVKSLQQ